MHICDKKVTQRLRCWCWSLFCALILVCRVFPDDITYTEKEHELVFRQIGKMNCVTTQFIFPICLKTSLLKPNVMNRAFSHLEQMLYLKLHNGFKMFSKIVLGNGLKAMLIVVIIETLYYSRTTISWI